ncbi:MAG: Sulfate adenylyltransferase [Candidatus Daviesbacteria bacterium GW2011_GWA2_42_7]|uniref:Sulfate adenylyltransferase n=1 Tax=Candidatus Daviesbacteria bacterium GW2011_GWA2_42_7 TaxID=1618425 RepID=A0A0G1BBK8_9BACT|nr:MAG: Sulfate adenylyltransferase [Candidatus Daviesbacteria bacterium GW2011_GWA2_42_7]
MNFQENKSFKKKLPTLPKVFLTERQLCDLELILNGGFSPLEGFLNEKDYNSVISKMRLSDGKLWPIPVVLDTRSIEGLKVEGEVLLCDNYEKSLAVLSIKSIYKPDKEREALLVYGTKNKEHFGVKYLLDYTNKYYIGGKVIPINPIERMDFEKLRFDPSSLKKEFKKRKWRRVIAFQTRNPMHKAHFHLIKEAARIHQAKVLIHPAVGQTKEGDIDYVTRVKCYEIIQEKYAGDFALVSLLPLAMRFAGPREAILHAIIRKNYGCTDFIVGRHHADPENDSKGNPFYRPFNAQEEAIKHSKEIGINIIQFPEMAYDEKEGKYVSVNGKNRQGSSVKKISGTEFRRMLRNNEEIPSWFSFPEVIKVLRQRVERQKGFAVFITGLPSSGKSTIAKALTAALIEKSGQNITFLDGDVVRKHLSRGLGFSEEDRKENIRRIGFVANEVVRHGGIAVCDAISPYEDVRQEVRRMIERNGTFVQIYLSTPLSVCKKRDVKGIYKKAELGLVKNVTGVDDVYEVPKDSEMKLDTSKKRSAACLNLVMGYLEEKKILR